MLDKGVDILACLLFAADLVALFQNGLLLGGRFGLSKTDIAELGKDDRLFGQRVGIFHQRREGFDGLHDVFEAAEIQIDAHIVDVLVILCHQRRQLQQAQTAEVIADQNIAADRIHRLCLFADEFCRFLHRQRIGEAVNAHLVRDLERAGNVFQILEQKAGDLLDLRHVFVLADVEPVVKELIRIRGDRHDLDAAFGIGFHLFFPVFVTLADFAVIIERIGDILADPADVGFFDLFVFRFGVADAGHEAVGLVERFDNGGFLLRVHRDLAHAEKQGEHRRQNRQKNTDCFCCCGWYLHSVSSLLFSLPLF